MITMATMWLLLLVVSSFQIVDVDSQSTRLPAIDDESCSDQVPVSMLERLLDYQQQLFQQQQQLHEGHQSNQQELLQQFQQLRQQFQQQQQDNQTNHQELLQQLQQLRQEFQQLQQDNQTTNQELLQQLQQLRQEHQQLFHQHQTVLNRLDEMDRSLTALTRRDCYETYKSGQRVDGVYTVFLGRARRPVEVYCDMTTDGGGWTVFQRRTDGSVDFYRYWNDYKTGFGNLTGEFWLGNDNLHLMTSDRRQRLRVDLADWEGNTSYAEFDNFTVESEQEKYRLASVGTCEGTAGNYLSYHVGKKFSTKDQDNDLWEGHSCAGYNKGGWWYGHCYHSNLNGRYYTGEVESPDAVVWRRWKYSLKFTQMKIRPFDV